MVRDFVKVLRGPDLQPGAAHRRLADLIQENFIMPPV